MGFSPSEKQGIVKKVNQAQADIMDLAGRMDTMYDLVMKQSKAILILEKEVVALKSGSKK